MKRNPNKADELRKIIEEAKELKEEVKKLFPDARILTLSNDTMNSQALLSESIDKIMKKHLREGYKFQQEQHRPLAGRVCSVKRHN